MLRTHTSFYGVYRELTPAEIEFLARFDVLITGGGILNDLDKIKALNPDIEFFRYHDMIAVMGSEQWPGFPQHWPHKYWDAIKDNEDWFIHATTGTTYGHRLIGRPWGWFLMDISNPDYRNFWINYSLELLEDEPLFDGIFGDDCWYFSKWTFDMWSTPLSPGGVAHGPGGVVPEQPNFVNDMVTFVREVKASIGSKLFVPNTRDSINFPPVCNGMNREGWVHLTWRGGAPPNGGRPDSWLTKEEILEHGEELSRISKQGKYYMAMAGIDRDEPGPEYERQLQLLCLAAFLISQNGPRASFGWSANYKFEQGFEEMFSDVGNPIGPAYEVAGTDQDVWGRDYENVRALVNLNWNTPYDVTVDETEYTLEAYSGIIQPLEFEPTPGFPFGKLATFLSSIGFLGILWDSSKRRG